MIGGLLYYKEKNGNLYKNIQKKRYRVESAETGENSYQAKGCANGVRVSHTVRTAEGVCEFRTPFAR